MRFNWDDFDQLLVVKRLRQVISKWWKIQLNFTDEKGYLRGVPKGKFFQPINPACKLITSTQKGFKGCMSTVAETKETAKVSKKEKESYCHAGFTTISLPVWDKKNFLGFIFADGFITKETYKEQKEKIKKHLRSHISSTTQIQEMIEKIPVLSKNEIKHLTQMIQVIIEEIIATEKKLQETKEEVRSLKEAQFSFPQKFSMIGQSKVMKNLFNLISLVSKTHSHVLIEGENGTGKELIANALHHNSPRKGKAFVVVNCGALSESLLEAELFGYKKGAFTGALQDHPGVFEQADGGTLFLDEVADTSPAMQVKLLRATQYGKFKPVGSAVEKKTDVRIISATNKNLEKMVQNETFREDLYYRLNVIKITAPPLRERLDDLPHLVQYFIEKNCRILKRRPIKMTETCYERLLNYSWPGNIRELGNEVERLCVLTDADKIIRETSLSYHIVSNDSKTKHSQPLSKIMNKVEKEVIRTGLKKNQGNKSALARELGVSPSSLLQKMRKHKIAS